MKDKIGTAPYDSQKKKKRTEPHRTAPNRTVTFPKEKMCTAVRFYTVKRHSSLYVERRRSDTNCGLSIHRKTVQIATYIIYFLTCRRETSCSIAHHSTDATQETRPTVYYIILHHADCTHPTPQHEANHTHNTHHTDHTDHTDQE